MKTENEFEKWLDSLVNNPTRSRDYFYQTYAILARDKILELARDNSDVSLDKPVMLNGSKDFNGIKDESAITISKLEELLGVKNEND